ncbi:MAG TPA: DUF3826 domain-containing protein [Sunxiuqinia sp.]|nr:DUF3826 domain-containing protein [Sunxiuqinia sp.]
MKIKLFAALLLLAVFSMANAQKPKTPEEAKYLEVLHGRAQKIVDNLGVENADKALKVRDIIAKQYWDLNKIIDGKDAVEKKLKKSGMSKAKYEAKKKKLDKKAQSKLDKLHKKYLANLHKNLTDKQVEGVKNGMTYNVLNFTYDGYLDMLPQLTEAQKKQIYAWLVEAREHAMDAGSSKAKHAWFGKYKGRINNYLSKEGYDLNKASKEWHERIKARKEKK